MNDAITNLKKSKLLYGQRCVEYEKAKVEFPIAFFTWLKEEQICTFVLNYHNKFKYQSVFFAKILIV